MSTEIPFANIVNRSPLNHSTAKMMYSFPKTERFNYGLGKNSSKTFHYNLPEVRNFRGTSIGFGKKSDFTKTNDINKVPFYDNKRGYDSNNSRSPAFTMGISRHFFEKVIQPKKGIPERNNPGPGRYNTLKSFGDEGLKISINPLKTEKPSKTVVTPGPGQYSNVDLSIGKKYTVSSFRNTVANVWGHSKEKRFRPPFKIVSPGPGTYSTKSLIDGSGTVYFSNFKSSTSKTITGRFKELSNKNPTPGPGAYNTTFTEFGGLHDYNKTHKSFDGRGLKTNNDSVKRSNFFNTNANENNNINSIDFKNELMDLNKITNENNKNLSVEEEKKKTISHKNSKTEEIKDVDKNLKTKTSNNRFNSENSAKKTSSVYNQSEKSNKINNNDNNNNNSNANNDNEQPINKSNNNISRNQSESNFERFKDLEKSAVSHKSSVKEFDKNSKISNKSSSYKSNNRNAAENSSSKSKSKSRSNFYNEDNKVNNADDYSNNNISRSSQKKGSEKGNRSSLNNSESKERKQNNSEFGMEARGESASNSRFYLNEKEDENEKNHNDNVKENSQNQSNYKQELE